ncbi:MAG: response regulator [Desulfobacterales bacterium]|nr:response regulator [Desulfobacterales bacterium]
MCHILVIDDEKHILEMIEMALTKFGHDVETATDGEEGIRKFDEKRFDLVITDIKMPRLDGNGVLQYIRNSKRRATPVIGISGTPWMLDGTNFDAVLAKPFLIKTLADYVRNLATLSPQNSAAGLNATLA